MKTFNVKKIRQDFPNLKVKIHGKPLVYLDNAATTFKPQSVIKAVAHYYTKETSNIHRGVHTLSELATKAFETARGKVKEFINAKFFGKFGDIVRLLADVFGWKGLEDF